MEQLLKRQMGSVGRTIVTVVEEVPPWQSFVAADDASPDAGIGGVIGARGPGVVLGGPLDDDDLAAKIVAETTPAPTPQVADPGTPESPKVLSST